MERYRYNFAYFLLIMSLIIGTNLIIRPIIFFVLIGFATQGFAEKNSIEIQGKYVVIKTLNTLELLQIKTEDTALWQNPKDMIKVHLFEFDTSLSALHQLTLDNIHQDANKFSIENNFIAPDNAKLLRTKTLLSNTEYNEFVVLGGNEKHAFKFTLSLPTPQSKTLKNKLQELFNKFHWEPANPSIVDNLPFTLQKIPGFRLTHKYANSVILASDDSTESIDAYIAISFLDEKSTNTSLIDRTTAIINNSKTLKKVEINSVNVSPEYKTPTAIARISAELNSERTLVDVLHATQLHDSDLLIVQIIVDRTSVSFLKLEDMAKNVLNSTQVK